MAITTNPIIGVSQASLDKLQADYEAAEKGAEDNPGDMAFLIKLQDATAKLTNQYSLSSNLNKRFSDTSGGIINNIK